MIRTRTLHRMFFLLPIFQLACGVPQGDLGGVPDMAADPGPAAVTGLPACTQTSVTSDMLYAVMQRSCAFKGCHDANGSPFGVSSAADMRLKLTSAAAETTRIPRVTPGDVDKSYVIYKLAGQQTKVAPASTAGRQMPLGASMLPDADLCQFVVWVRNGAN